MAIYKTLLKKRNQIFHNDIANRHDLEFYFIQCNKVNIGILIIKQNTNLKCYKCQYKNPIFCSLNFPQFS